MLHTRDARFCACVPSEAESVSTSRTLHSRTAGQSSGVLATVGGRCTLANRIYRAGEHRDQITDCCRGSPTGPSAPQMTGWRKRWTHGAATVADVEYLAFNILSLEDPFQTVAIDFFRQNMNLIVCSCCPNFTNSEYIYQVRS